MNAVELWKLMAPLRKWWWLLLLAGLLAGASSVAYGLTKPPLYESRSTLMVGTIVQNPNPQTSEVYASQALAATYANMAMRDPAKQAAMRSLEIDWLPTYSVLNPPNSQVLEIRAIDVDAQRAQQVVNAIINYLIGISPEGNTLRHRNEFLQDQLQKLEEGIRTTELAIEHAQNDLAAALSARDIRAKEDEIRALEGKMTALQDSYAALLSNTSQGSLNTIQVLEPATLPTQPVDSGLLLTVVIAVLVGVLFAVGGAYFLEFADDRLQTADRVKDQTSLSVLGAFPLSIHAGNSHGALVMLEDSYGTAAESIRVLRTNLLFASVDHELGSLLVSSPVPGEGKSFVSSNLAVAFAQTGQRVVLLDADLRKPSLHRIFDLVNNVGITSALISDMVSLGTLVQQTVIPELHVITSGPLPPNPSELLSSTKMERLLRQLEEQYDLVVVDSPPVTVVSDTAVLASRADGVLIVLSADRSRRDLARNALAALDQVNARVLGAVLNRTNATRHGFYYSLRKEYGNQYYGAHYTSRPKKKSASPGAVPSVSESVTASSVVSIVSGNGSAGRPIAERTKLQ